MLFPEDIHIQLLRKTTPIFKNEFFYLLIDFSEICTSHPKLRKKNTLFLNFLKNKTIFTFLALIKILYKIF